MMTRQRSCKTPIFTIAILASALSTGCGSVSDANIDLAADSKCDRLEQCELLQDITRTQCVEEFRASVESLTDDEVLDVARTTVTCTKLSSCEASAACLDTNEASCEPLFDGETMAVAMNVCMKFEACGMFVEGETLESCTEGQVAFIESLCPAQASEYRIQVNTCAAIVINADPAADCISFADCIAANFSP